MSSPAFPGDPVATTPHSECRGLGLIPGGGTGSCMPHLRSQHAATKRAHVFITLAKRPKWTSTVWCGCITQRGLPTSPDYQLSWWTICCDGLCWAFDPEERWSSSSWPSVSQSCMKPWGPVSDSPLTVPQRQEEGACRGPLEPASHIHHPAPRKQICLPEQRALGML